MLRSIRWLKGYVVVRVSGIDVERFMNLCRHHHITIWNVTYHVEYYTFSMYRQDFIQLKRFIRKTQCKCKIIKKKGLFSFLFRYRKRKIFAAGILLFFILLYVCSKFIWVVEIEGNYSITKEDIYTFLKDNKVYAGVSKDDISCEQLEKELRNHYFDMTWVSVECKGTTLRIHIKENIDQQVVEETKEPYHIVANHDATITSIVTRTGSPCVSVNTQVKKGDMLVSGIVTILDDSQQVMATNLVNSDADIYGKVVYPYEDAIPLEYQEKNYDSKVTHGIAVGLFSKIIQLGGDRKAEKNKKIETDTKTTQLELYENFYLPVYYSEITQKQYTYTTKTYTKEQVIEKCNEKFRIFLENLEEKGIQITGNNVKIEVTDKMCYARGSVYVIEKLGTIQTITQQEVDELTSGIEEETDYP